MPIDFSCALCGATLRVDDQLAGQRVRCSGCQQTIRVAMVSPTAISERPAMATVPAETTSWPVAEPEPPPRFVKQRPWLLITVAALLVCLMAAAAIYLLMPRRGPSLEEIARYAPARCWGVGILHGRDFFTSETWEELDRRLPGGLAKLMKRDQDPGDVLPDKQIDTSFLFAVRGMSDKMTATRTLEDVTGESALKGLKVEHWKTETIAGHTCYLYQQTRGGRPPEDEMLCILEPRFFLQGTPALVREVLERDRPGKLSAELNDALARADRTQPLLLAFDLTVFKSQLKDLPRNGIIEFVEKIHHIVLQLELDKGARLHGWARCNDDKTAAELQAMASASVTLLKVNLPADMPPVIAEILGKVKIEANGPQVIGQIQVDLEQMVAAAKTAAQNLDNEKLPLAGMEPPPVKEERPVRPERPVPVERPPRPPADRNQTPFSPPPAAAPRTIRAPDLQQNRLEVALPGKADDVCVAGGGRYLAIHFPDQAKLALFDVSTATLGAQADLPRSEPVLLAAGMNHVVVVKPKQSGIERYTIPDLKRDAQGSYVMKVPAVAAAMGCASNGPLVVTGVDWPRLGETMFFDVVAMKRHDLNLNPHDIFTTSPNMSLRAGANGRLFACKSQNGTRSALITKDSMQIFRGQARGNSVLPDAEGTTLFIPGQLLAPNFTPQGPHIGGHGKMVWYVPAVHGREYLSLNEIKTGRIQKLRLDVHTQGKPDVKELGTPEDTVGLVDWISGRTQPFENHVFLVPQAKVLVILPVARDRLVLLRTP
ncbi:MAG: hypothetical protein AB7K24_04065 [Gemmataceae bacterium]